MLEQSVKGVCEHLIRSIDNKYVGCGHFMAHGNSLPQAFAQRIRIKAQRLPNFGAQRFQYPGTGTVGVLVGIEFDQVGQLGLLARHIGGQAVNHGAPEAAHLWIRYWADFAWAGSPSPAASSAAARMSEIKAGLDETWFAWSGPLEAGKAYFRIQGPTIFIEFAPQRSEMHLHSMYRDPTNDYGKKFTGK